MSNEPLAKIQTTSADKVGTIALPCPTIAPFASALGLSFLAIGIATHSALIAVGGALFVFGLVIWIRQLLPQRGHLYEVVVSQPLPPTVAERSAIGVRHLKQGMPGYRLRLPERVHPISAGVRGGIVGGLAMPVPALLYGLLSGHGIWYPVNLLTGMVLPGINNMSVLELSRFYPTLTVLAVAIHAVLSVVIGLLYGVLMPTLPFVPKPLAWGGLMMPLLWTAVTFSAMRYVNPLLATSLDWPWFITSQFLFGVVAAVVVMYRAIGPNQNPLVAGLLGGIAGGLLMPLPAAIWAIAQRTPHLVPVNLLAGMVQSGLQNLSNSELEQFHANWFVQAAIIHICMSLGFGLLYGQLLPRLKPIPRPLAWGGLLLPLFWTATTYGLMGVVNPLLERRVDWPWFIVSQFIFGLLTATVVVRSEQIQVPPASGSNTMDIPPVGKGEPAS